MLRDPLPKESQFFIFHAKSAPLQSKAIIKKIKVRKFLIAEFSDYYLIFPSNWHCLHACMKYTCLRDFSPLMRLGKVILLRSSSKPIFTLLFSHAHLTVVSLKIYPSQ